jgi:hypothetical protein
MKFKNYEKKMKSITYHHMNPTLFNKYLIIYYDQVFHNNNNKKP